MYICAYIYLYIHIYISASGHWFLKAGWRKKLAKELRYVQAGLLSDRPGVELYVRVGTLGNGFVVYRCCRGIVLLYIYIYIYIYIYMCVCIYVYIIDL